MTARRSWCRGDCAMYHACACPDKLDRHPSGDVADVPAVEFAAGDPTPEERQRFEDELVAIVADVLIRQRTIVA